MNEIEELVFDNIPIFEEEKEDNIDEELDFLLEDEFNNFDSNSSTLNEAEEDEISEEDAEDLVTSEDNKKKKSNNDLEENTQEEVSEETNEEQPTEADAEDLVDSDNEEQNNESDTEENIDNTQEEETSQTENTEENNEDEETDGNETQEEGSAEGEEEPSEEDLANAEEKAKEDKDRYSYYQLFEEMYDNIKLLVDKTKDIIERTNNNTNEKGILRTILDEIYVVKEDIEYLLIEKINSMEVNNINILYITFSSKVMLLLDLIQKITSNKES